MVKRTRQQAFNVAVRGLASQGFLRSMNGSNCAYRSFNGSKCAIGHLIPDKDYKPEWEDHGCFLRSENSKAGKKVVEDVAWDIIVAAGLDPLKDAEFAQKLQQTHDMDGFARRGMRQNLINFSFNWGLKLPKELQDEA